MKKITPILISCCIVSLFVLLKTSPSAIATFTRNRLNNISYDLKIKIENTTNTIKHPDIVIIDIDDKSLKKIGRWPWPRKTMSSLYNALWKDGASVIAADILFPEPEINPAVSLSHSLHFDTAVRKKLLEKKSHFDNDRLLSNSIKKGESVMSYVFFKKSTIQQGRLPRPLRNTPKTANKDNSITQMHGYLTSIPRLTQHSVDSGFTSYFRDSDGISRKVPMLLSFNTHLYYSFSIAVVKTFLLEDDVIPHFFHDKKRALLHDIQVGDYKIPTDASGEVLIPFHGPRFSFPYISASDVLSQHYNKSQLKNKIILIGTSAIGLSDLHGTPAHPAFPGVEVQANVIQGIIDHNIPYRAPWVFFLELTLLILIGIILSILLPISGPIVQVIVSLAFIILLVTTDAYLWSHDGLSIHLASTIIMIFSLGLFNFLYGFLITTNHDRQLKKAFSRYISPDQVNIISKNPSAFNFDGEERDMSVLFCDIRNFTTISEKLTASRLKKLLNDFFTPLTKVIFDNKGTIDKYIGDMIMAFWGAPLENLNHANDAITAGLEMIEAKNQLLIEYKEKGLPEFRVGIGINSGKMNVGDMGSEYRLSYTVIGDNVNIGSRLESLNKTYGVNILISENTYKKQTQYFCLHLDTILVKGKQESISIYHPLCRLEDVKEEHIKINKKITEAFSLYQQQQWESASKKFQELRATYTNAVYCDLFIDRIARYKKNPPPPSWDGSFQFTVK